MENSNNPSSSSVQDVAQSPEKKSLGNKSTKKMSPMKPNAAKMPAKAAKKQDTTLKKSTSSNRVRTSTPNDSLMADFQSGQGKAKTAMGMPLKDFSESAVALLLSNYKVENEKVLSTTALAM